MDAIKIKWLLLRLRGEKQIIHDDSGKSSQGGCFEHVKLVELSFLGFLPNPKK
jgi:hypothetical protein